MTLDTPQLIKKIQQASSDGKDTPARREAFSELVRRYQDLAYGCALSMLGDPALAEDAAQNAFMTTYFTLHTINKPEVFAAWLRRIISRQCARMLKEQQHYKISIDEQSEIEDTSENPYETTAGSEEQQLVRHALTRLPADLRMTTVLYYLTGYSVGEIAACMELPQSTVQSDCMMHGLVYVNCLNMYLSPHYNAISCLNLIPLYTNSFFFKPSAVMIRGKFYTTLTYSLACLTAVAPGIGRP